MLIEIISKLAGGTWKLRERCRTSKSPGLRQVSLRLYKLALYAKGSWISHEAEFGTIPIFPHGIYGIFISGGVSIGKNCVIFQQVTIGSNTMIDSARLGAPTIGDNCYIGVGAKIIGNVRLGNNVRVGANAVVVKDVPDNSVVFAGSSTIVTKDYRLINRFYQNNDQFWRYFEEGVWSKVVDPKELALLKERFPKAPMESSDIALDPAR